MKEGCHSFSHLLVVTQSNSLQHHCDFAMHNTMCLYSSFGIDRGCSPNKGDDTPLSENPPIMLMLFFVIVCEPWVLDFRFRTLG